MQILFKTVFGIVHAITLPARIDLCFEANFKHGCLQPLTNRCTVCWRLRITLFLDDVVGDLLICAIYSKAFACWCWAWKSQGSFVITQPLL